MATLTVETFNTNHIGPDNNDEYNLDLTAFTDVTYVKSEDEYGFEPNIITFNQTPTLTEIQNCFQTNVNRIQELVQKAIQNDDDDAFYDYIPDYVKELLFFMEGLREVLCENKLLILNREHVIPYINQLQNMDLDGFSLEMLEEFIGSN